MSNVIVDKYKLDILANAIADKSGEPLTMTLDEMAAAVDGIDSGGITPAGNIDITQAGVTDVTSYATATVPAGTVIGRTEAYTSTNTLVGINSQNQLYIEGTVPTTPSVGTEGYVDSTNPSIMTVNLRSSVTPVNPTPTVSGDTVTTPAGYYSSSKTSTVSSGTAGTPTATKGTVSNHSVSVTPSVTNTTGYITGSTKTGTAVTVSASELVSGSETKTANGTYDVTNLASLVVNVSGGTSKNTQVVQGTSRTVNSSMQAIGARMTVSKTGTYDVYWSAFRSNTSSSYTYATQLYINGSAYGSENSTWTYHAQTNHLTGVSLTANQYVQVYGRESRGSNYYIYAPTLVIVEA